MHPYCAAVCPGESRRQTHHVRRGGHADDWSDGPPGALGTAVFFQREALCRAVIVELYRSISE